MKLERLLSLGVLDALPSKACAADLTNSFELPNCCISIFSDNPAEDINNNSVLYAHNKNK